MCRSTTMPGSISLTWTGSSTPCGGVNVTVPDVTSSFGHVFHLGVNHLNGIEALDYAREPALSQEGRVLRQQSLMRAVIRKIEFRHLLSNPLTMYRVLHALISMLTVDSNFTTSELEHLAREVRDLTGSTDYVTAPVHMRARAGLPRPQARPPALGGDQAGLDLGVRQALPVHGDARRAPVGDAHPRAGPGSLLSGNGGKDDVQRVGPGGQPGPDGSGSLGPATARVGRPRSWRPRPRLVVVALAVLVALAGLTVGGCLYISQVAAGMARAPVMFDVSPSQTPTAPR